MIVQLIQNLFLHPINITYITDNIIKLLKHLVNSGMIDMTDIDIGICIGYLHAITILITKYMIAMMPHTTSATTSITNSTVGSDVLLAD